MTQRSNVKANQRKFTHSNNTNKKFEGGTKKMPIYQG